MAKAGCGCEACGGLMAECGELVFDLYARKLLYHGWAGAMTDVERAYRLAHSEQARKQAEQGAARAGLMRAGRSSLRETPLADGLDDETRVFGQGALELG